MLRNSFSDRSKFLLGGLIGSLVIVFFLSYPVFLPTITAQDAVLEHSQAAKALQTPVGEEPLSKDSQVLSLTEIFERSENIVIKLEQRPDT